MWKHVDTVRLRDSNVVARIGKLLLVPNLFLVICSMCRDMQQVRLKFVFK